jgi:hypothetical protein
MRPMILVGLLIVGGCSGDSRSSADLSMVKCGDRTCAAGELCIPGCRGVCGCDPVPDSGVCAYGACTCGTIEGCALPPPAPYCASSLPPGCSVVNGMIQCLCA